jgi:hypothetical protein
MVASSVMTANWTVNLLIVRSFAVCGGFATNVTHRGEPATESSVRFASA